MPPLQPPPPNPPSPSSPAPAAPALPPARPFWRRDGVLAAVLVVLVALAYSPVWHAGFIWDDDDHVYENPRIVGPEGLKEIWTTPAANYFPLVLTTFKALHAVWGLNPLPYHLANVACHLLAALLLWRVLRQLALPGAWFGAALWALHPVQAESVAWISELKNTQSAVFFLLATSCFLRWQRARDSRANTSSWRPYALALLCAVLALLSKPSTVMLPVALALLWWWRAERWSWARAALWLLPFFALSALTAGWTVWEQKYHSLALGPDWNQSVVERLAISGRAVWFYLGKLLWPHPLVFIYPRWTIAVGSVWSYLPFAAAVGTLGALAWRARSARHRTAFVVAASFVALLFPVLGFFDVYYFLFSYVADHFQYLASMAVLPALAATAAVGLRAAVSALAWVRPTLATTVLVACAVLTWREAGEYHDKVTHWSAVRARNPGAWLAHVNLGNEFFAQGRFDDAMPLYLQALQVRPNYAKAHFDLGTAWLAKRDAAHAIPEFETALRLDPRYTHAHHNLGTALALLERYPEAATHFTEAVRLDPRFVDAHRNLGFVLLMLNQPARAERHFRTVLQLSPGDPRALRALQDIEARR
ncbi:tetratricopeptide repeat protein [Opitutus sp. ER46]|uniref:tetratricopeptide repeat protein n=1 Tax=Opitutus sp. ER46 TaxID=2161864 RepID=UPI000D2F8301|nr:tetratricopeptide repeat protein [Opitutus sp. ER46]PTX97684.1 hypothetical protein DB354_05215 [Opitutus sp. ER46]